MPLVGCWLFPTGTRPNQIADRTGILASKAEGASLRNIAAKLGIGYGTVRTRLQA
jgi:transposase